MNFTAISDLTGPGRSKSGSAALSNVLQPIHFIRRLATYPLDKVIHSLNNWVLIDNFSWFTEYIESQIPPLFYSVSGEIIQASDITGKDAKLQISVILALNKTLVVLLMQFATIHISLINANSLIC